jgi:hypothetical protein
MRVQLNNFCRRPADRNGYGRWDNLRAPPRGPSSYNMWRRQGLPDNIRAMPSRTATRPRELRSHQVAQHVGAIQHFAEPFGQQGRCEIKDEGSPPCCLEQVAHLVVVACDGRNGQAAERGGCQQDVESVADDDVRVRRSQGSWLSAGAGTPLTCCSKSLLTLRMLLMSGSSVIPNPLATSPRQKNAPTTLSDD